MFLFMLIEQKDIADYLGNCTEGNKDIFSRMNRDETAFSRLKVGTKVQKTSGLFYEIDDLQVVFRLWDFEKGTIPYGLIHNALTASPREREIHEIIRNEGRDYEEDRKIETPQFGLRRFDPNEYTTPNWARDHNGSRKLGKVLPFSVAVEIGMGSCLEKSILVQLTSQDTTTSFLIDGFMDDQYGSGCHVFNVVYLADNPVLIDAENPLIANGSFVPFIAPLLQINDGKFEVPAEWNAGRTYRIT
jgi:hypothetical protein